jgi:hypothetical protein
MTGRQLSADELALVMRADPAKVVRLTAEGMPRNKNGTYDLAAVAEYLEGTGLGRRCNWRGAVRTLGEVAAAFGVSRDTVRKDWRASGMPGKSGRYDLAEIAEWKSARDRDPARAAEGLPAGEDLRRKRAAEARIREGQAARIERQNRIAEEQICYRADVERFLSQLFELIRELHARLPAEMRPQLPKQHRTQISHDIVARLENIQRTLHAWVRRLDEIAEG